MKCLRWIYSCCFALALPFILMRLLWLSRLNRQYRQGISDRLGLVRPLSGQAIWLHAVSVGEVIAAVPLIRALKVQFPDKHIVMTTTTPTGAAQVHGRLGEDVKHYYLPYDIPFILSRFLRRLNIRACLIIETEIWPNLLHCVHKKQLPLLLVNARLSLRARDRYARLRGFMRWMLSHYTLVMTRTQVDAQYFLSLGLSSSQLAVTGNIKFDLTIPRTVHNEGAILREKWGQRFVWVAGSTHEGEEALMLAVQKKLLQVLPNALLILVPRHPGRFDSVAKQIESSGLMGVRHTGEQDEATGQVQVYLVDAMGELLNFYASCDAVVMGGTFVEVGGHNFLEPAALSKALLSGPQLFNFKEVSELLIENGALEVVSEAPELVARLSAISQPDRLVSLGERAYQVVQNNRGAVQRSMDCIVKVI